MRNSRVKVKVCGMTQVDQVRDVVDLGVDAIGMILHADSPRKISLQQAKDIREVVPALVSLVGVFVDCELAKVEELAQSIGLDLLQLHGNESADYAAQLSTPYIKAIRAKSLQQVQADIDAHNQARAILLDPYVPGQHGGTGRQLNPSLWPSTDKKLILAGGLSADNVAAAVETVRPYAVDLNSGVEESPGNKRPELVEQVLLALGR